MHFQDVSPSSSVSSRTGSPDTRATTPSISFDGILHTHLPAIYVNIAASSVSYSVLQVLFETHSICNRMGLIIAKGTTEPPAAAIVQWKEQELPCSAVLYKISSSYHPPESFAVCPVYVFPSIFDVYEEFQPRFLPEASRANQHLSITAARLRAILTLILAEDFTLYILEKPPFTYLPLSLTVRHGLAPSVDGTKGNIPTVEDWKNLWANWDLVTLKMISPTMLLQKPIDLRHKCLFYIGHIPTCVNFLVTYVTN